MPGPLRVLLYCVLGAAPMLIGALGDGKAVEWALSGLVMAAAFVPVALFGPRRTRGQFGVILPALGIITVFCTWSEALLFVPAPEIRDHAARNLAGSLVMYGIVGCVLAVLPRLLKLTREEGSAIERRSPASVVVLVLACGLAYALYYLVFGAITYQYFTKGYYPQAEEIARGLGLWFWAIQVGRGALMTAAVLPAIYTLRMPRMQAAVAIGLLIWIAGGAAPLLIPNELMTTTQRFIHVVEIFTQNAALGATAVLLLRPRGARTTAAPPQVAGAA